MPSVFLDRHTPIIGERESKQIQLKVQRTKDAAAAKASQFGDESVLEDDNNASRPHRPFPAHFRVYEAEFRPETSGLCQIHILWKNR